MARSATPPVLPSSVAGVPGLDAHTRVDHALLRILLLLFFVSRVASTPSVPCALFVGCAQVFASCEKVLVPEDMHQFGPDYALTLEAWRRDWLAREDDELQSDVDPKDDGVGSVRFRRMWWLYLAMCQALFEVRHANLTQFVFSKRGLWSSKEVLNVRAASEGGGGGAEPARHHHGRVTCGGLRERHCVAHHESLVDLAIQS